MNIIKTMLVFRNTPDYAAKSCGPMNEWTDEGFWRAGLVQKGLVSVGVYESSTVDIFAKALRFLRSKQSVCVAVGQPFTV